MKNFLSFVSKYKIQFLLALVAIVAFVLFLCGCEEGTSTLAFAVVAGEANKGKHVTGEGADGVLTTDVAKENSDILENTIDQKIVKINPSSTPIDQISRLADARTVKSFEFEYYSVDTLPRSATVAADTLAVDPKLETAVQPVSITISEGEIFQVSDTIMVNGVQGYDENGQPDGDLILYVRGINTDGSLSCIAVNGIVSGTLVGGIPVIPKDTKLIRMGRAAAEIDAQSPAYEALPQKEVNFCQIFKFQVEQSTFQNMHQKEIPWSFSDLEESAVMDMRMGMEKSFIFSKKRKIWDALKKSWIYITGGIWWQAGKEFEYDPSKPADEAEVIEMLKEAFTGNGGNKKRVLVAGSDYIERLNKITFNRQVDGEQTQTNWGIDFTLLKSKFGIVNVLHSETFDDAEMSGAALLIDPEYLDKHIFKPFGREELDLKKAGVRNTDAVVLTEVSALTLRYPNAHMRIVPKKG